MSNVGEDVLKGTLIDCNWYIDGYTLFGKKFGNIDQKWQY